MAFRPYRPVTTSTSYHYGISVQERMTTDIAMKIIDKIDPLLMSDEQLEDIARRSWVIASAIIKITP